MKNNILLILPVLLLLLCCKNGPKTMIEEEREKWFYEYINKTNEAISKSRKSFMGYFYCPCCKYPTLTEPAAYDVCPVCNWEDDGQDDPHADEVWGGPNHGYSLTEARHNFKKYYTMYNPKDEWLYEITTVIKNEDGEIKLDLLELKKKIMQKFDELYTKTDTLERQKSLKEIEKLIGKRYDY